MTLMSLNPSDVRVLLMDDHAVFLDSLAHYLRNAAGFTQVHCVLDAVHCGDSVRYAQPDVVVMDLAMPGLNAFERLAQILAAAPRAAVLILTSALQDYSLSDLLRHGARGYLPKDADAAQLVGAILALAQGQMVVHAQSAALFSQPSGLDAAQLSKRERDLLALMSEGYSNKEIASRLFLSTGTVKSYSSRLFDKIGVRDRTQAVLHGIKHGLVNKPRAAALAKS
jgi:two-component system, NarL family, response regulator LiaR